MAGSVTLRDGAAVREWRRRQKAEPTTSVTLEAPLEALGDPWPVLRDLWQGMADGATLAVRYGAGGRYRLRSKAVLNLLRLTGFRALSRRRSDGVIEVRAQRERRAARALSCTVVVPCRNELDNIEPLVRRLPAIGTHTELIFVDGASTDGTPDRIEAVMATNPDRDIKLLHQRAGGGKAAAVYQGFDAASGDVIIILDADMTVAPEDLHRFYLPLAEGLSDFANGTRFVYPMERGAMPPLNNLGNRAFGTLFSWVLGTRITDTLCGTKAILKRDWPQISAARPLFGGHDPWGDFDLLLGAAYAHLRIIEVPVVYGARVAGESKMQPMRHGVALARTSLAGVRHLKLPHRRAA